MVAVFASGAILALVPATVSAAQPECRVARLAATKASYNSKTHAKPLAAAIAEAAAGDTLQIVGTCHGNFVIDKTLTLEGRASNQQADTLDGDGNGTVLAINGGSNSSNPVVVTVSHLDIVKGETGIMKAKDVDLTIADSTITANTGWGVRAGESGYGGLVGTLTLNRSNVSDNGGGGIFANADLVATVALNDSTVGHNGATGIAASKPPFVSNGTTVFVTLNRSSVVDNDGSGVSAVAKSVGLTVTDSRVSGNASTGIHAGGLGGGSMTADRSIVSDNRGGGISVGYVSATLTDSIVSGNSTEGNGGGIVGPFPAAPALMKLTDTTVRDNHAVGHGGGIYSPFAELIDSTVSGNTAGASGGGVYVTTIAAGPGIVSGRLNLTGSTVTDNTAGISGGGIFAEPGAALTLDGSEICGNAPDDAPECSPPL